MQHPLTLALLGGLALACVGHARADDKFESVSVRLERNVSDRDAEIVFEITGGDAGMAALKVAAPDGRTVVDFAAPDAKLGIRHFSVESPEARDLAALLRDYPAGQYTVTARTVDGTALSGKAMLSHKLPDAVTLVRPRAGEDRVAARGLRIRWGANNGRHPASHVLSIENDRTGAKLIQVTLPGAATTYAVPDSVLAAGTRYKVSIGAVTRDGNGSFVETAFTTAKK